MGRNARRIFCLFACLSLLLTWKALANDVFHPIQIVEENLSFLEADSAESLSIVTPNTKKITIALPITAAGQAILAVYDENSRFIKALSVHSGGRTSVEFVFEETPLKLGSYVRAFFVGENWEPLVRASEKVAVKAEQKISEMFLTSDGLLSFKTDIEGAMLWFNGTLLSYETKTGWNLVNVTPLNDSLNEISLQKTGYTEWSTLIQSNSLINLRISEYPKRIYRLNETLDITGIKVEGTTNGSIWFELPIVSEQIRGFQSSTIGDLGLTVEYGNQSVVFTARVVASAEPTQTSAGLFSLTPSEAFQTDIRDIQLRYTIKELFVNGSLSFSLPSGLLFQDTDLILLPGMTAPRKVSELSAKATIQNEGSNLNLSSLDVVSGEIIEIMLLQRELPRLANLQIEVIADSDGNAEIFTPATKMMQSINLTPGEAMSGKLFLPVGKVAPAGGLLVQLHAVGTQEYTKDILITEGSSEISYRFVLPQGQYKMHYVVPNFTEQRQITYYDTTGIYGVDQVEMLTVNAGGFNLNVQICEYFQISGTIRLPNDETAKEDTVIITRWKNQSKNYTHYVYSVLSAASNSVTYTLDVEPGNFIGTYGFSLKTLQYVNSGYYSRNGTKLFQSEAEIMNFQENKFGIDLTIIKGFVVTGKITLPVADIPMSKSMPMSVYANSGNNYVHEYVSIEAGDREVTYQIVLPQGNYVFGYSLSIQDTPYVSHAYYSIAGTTVSPGTSTTVAIDNNVYDINMELQKGYLVSGKILIPETDATPDKDILVFITSLDGSHNISSSSATIKAGNKEAQYQILVPLGTFSFKYHTNNQETSYLKTGYFSNSGTTYSSSASTNVFVDRNLNDINMTLINAYFVTGKISIPETDAAPDKDLSIRILAYSSGYSIWSNQILIEAGAKEANYQLMLPTGTYYFYYEISSADAPYLKNGYYSTSGTTNSYSSRTNVILDSNKTAIDFTIREAHLLTGKITIPISEPLLDKDISVQIYASSTGYSIWSNPIYIKAGTSEANYQFSLPKGTYGLQTYINNASEVPYYQYGFYSSNGTTYTSSTRTYINLFGDSSGYDMTLIKGYFVSGKIEISETDSTPDKDIAVQVIASSPGYSLSKSIIIKAGTREANYQMVLPEESYTLRFYINTQDTPFVREGFYSINGTVPRELASSILVDKNISNLDLVLQKKSFFGTVSLPNNISVLTENLEVRVISESISDVSETSVTIYSGERTANFVLPMAAGENIVKYQIGANDNFITQGYYYYGGTYPNLNYAQKYNTTNHISNIIFTLVPAYSLTGKVSLPEGEIAGAEGIAIKLTTEALYASAQAPSAQILIGPGQSSANFELKQLWGAYRLRYELVNSSNQYIQIGYLGASKTVLSESDSQILVFERSNVNDVNFEVLRKTLLQGSISLPTSYTNNDNRIPVAIYVSGSNLRVIETEIAQGETSASFVGEVPVGDYEIYYDLKETSNTWVARGYYSPAGMQLTSPISEPIYIGKEGLSSLSLQLIPLTKLQGIISLPSGVDALNSGLSAVVYAFGDLSYRHILEVPTGSNQISYEFFLPVGNYKLLLVVETVSTDIMPVAYYSDSGMKIRPEQATEVFVSDLGLVQNLQLIAKPKMSGFVALPEGIVAPPEGLTILMKAYSPSALFGVSTSNLQLVSSANLQLVSAADLQLASSSNLVTQAVQIPSGENSASYQLPVNPGEYTLSYELITPSESLMENGFYTSNGVSSVATEKVIVQTDDIPNINLELLSKSKISGQIILPEGMLAPPEGMTMQMTVIGGEEVSISCIIPSGEASTDFVFYLDPGEYYLRYHITNDSTLLKEGYLNNEGQSTKSLSDAKQIILDVASSSNVTLQLQKLFYLTGTVKTDGLYPLTDNGLDLIVRAIGKSTYTSLIHLSEDQPQTNFSLSVPEDTYKVVVVVDESQALYYKSGYLSSGVLTTEVEQAEVFLLNADLAIGSITVPTKIVNIFKVPELTTLSEVVLLEKTSGVEKVSETPANVEKVEKEADVASQEQVIQALEPIEGIPMEEDSETSIESEEELNCNENPDVGVLNDLETVETDMTVVENAIDLTENTEEIVESTITEDTEEIVELVITESTEEILELGFMENTNEEVIEGVEGAVAVEKNELTDTSAVLISEVTEPEGDSSVSLLSINPITLDPIIVKLSSSTINSIILTIKLPVVDSAFTNVWIGSQNYIIQPDGTFNFSFNNLVEGTTIYEIIAIDSSANSTFGKLIIASVPDSDSFEDYLLRWDRTGPVIQLEDVYTVTSKPAIISFHVSDESRVSEVWVGYEKAFVGPGGSTYISLSNLQVGVNEFDVLAYDEHGNATASTLVVEYLKPTTVVLTIGSTFATKDGANMTGMDQAPVIVNGRVFLPFRFVFMNLLGSTVDWDAYTQTITSVVKGNTIKMVIGSRTAYVNGNAVVMLEAPYIESMTGRTLVPMREIMEAIGISLDWNGTTQTVTITIPQ